MAPLITAIVPAREGSRRLPDKNIAPFAGSNLLLWKLEQLKSCPEVESIVVSSNSTSMLRMAENAGVKVHKRDDRYCDEVSEPFGCVVKHICENTDGEHILWAPCTAPLVTSSLFSSAIAAYFEALKSGYDSLVSVEPFKRYIWNNEGPVNYKLGMGHVPSQNLEEWFFITDGILLAPRKKMIQWSYFHGTLPFKFRLEKIHAIDVDDALDLATAQSWMKLLE